MDESFRQVLPLLRPTPSVDFTWVAAVGAGFLLAMLGGAATAYAITRWRARARTRRAFYAVALERRLTREQIRLLLDLAGGHRMRDPLLLLTSLKTFDRHVGRFASAAAREDERVDALGEVRRRLGFDSPSRDEHFHTTRTLQPGQTLMVWAAGSDIPGFLQVVVVDRDERAITAVPLLREDDRRLSALAAGDLIKVRFWRRGDTEYRFRTDILEVEPRTTSIRIRHAERLERVQLRDFYRVPVDFEVTLYAVDRERAADMEAAALPSAAAARLRALVGDLSGGGLSASAEEAVPDGTVVIIDPHLAGQFPIGGLRCEVVEQSPADGRWHLRLHFLEVPRDVQDDLVAALFSHQLRTALQ